MARPLLSFETDEEQGQEGTRPVGWPPHRKESGRRDWASGVGMDCGGRGVSVELGAAERAKPIIDVEFTSSDRIA